MKTNNRALNEVAVMLSESKRKPQKKGYLLEGYLSEDDFDPSMQEVPQQQIPQGNGENFPLQGMNGGDGDAMVQEKGILPIKNEIDQIRQIALKTIARLAENPLSESYQMMKKIWIMCDKAIECTLQTEENNSK